MSGGGYLLAHDAGLYRRAAKALIALGGREATAALGGGVVQLADEEGHLFTLYELVPLGTEGEAYGAPFAGARSEMVPDRSIMVACPFECRWPDMMVRLAGVIARTAEAPTWVLDGDGVVWDADDVDPSQVVL